MAKFGVAFDLDEGWEQFISIEADSLEDAQRIAVDILYDFNNMMDESDFKIYELSKEHSYWMDDEPLKSHWEKRVAEEIARSKKYREQAERSQFEALKKKYGD